MRINLLTCEEVLEIYPDAVERLKLLPNRVMLRIPIQWNDDTGSIDEPQDYVDAFKALSEVADIMIEFVDSQHMKHFTPNSYKRHVKNCLQLLSQYCRVGEAGNEVNGDWLGRQTAEKVRRALEACRAAGLQTSITYYLEANNPAQMFEWIDMNPLTSNYALISHYPNTTPSHRIDPEAIFSEFAGKFPQTTVLGWGEYGTQDENGNNTAPPSERAALIRQVEVRWWNLISPALSNYAGFGGYWDWATDKELDQIFKEVWI